MLPNLKDDSEVTDSASSRNEETHLPALACHRLQMSAFVFEPRRNGSWPQGGIAVTCCKQRSSDMVRSCLERASSSSSSFQVSPSPGDRRQNDLKPAISQETVAHK